MKSIVRLQFEMINVENAQNRPRIDGIGHRGNEKERE
jgi:hypothetical protein